MKTVRPAIVLTGLGLVVCLWLLAGVNWYSFSAFMLLGQPFLVLGLLIFFVVLARVVNELRRGVATEVRHKETP